jgi:hypothetical protein
MNLLHLMHDTPLWVVAVLLTVGALIDSIGLMLVTRVVYGVDRLSLNNEVAGFKFAVIGVFYAVMLAFVVIAVWEDFRKTEAAVRDEAKAVVDLYRFSFGLPVEGGAEIRKHLIAYTNDVREHEWPTMAVGEPSDEVIKDLDRLSGAMISAVSPGDFQQLAVYQNALRLLALITDNRNERLDSSDGSMPWIRPGRADHAARTCFRLSVHRRCADLSLPVRSGLAPNAADLAAALNGREPLDFSRLASIPVTRGQPVWRDAVGRHEVARTGFERGLSPGR